jgi:FkbM family methyltransferase
MKPTLTEIILSKNLVTDKHSLHSYTDYFYEQEFAKYREKPVQIVEIGFDQGGSLVLWAEYFSQARILGIDLQLRGNCEQDCAQYPGIQLALGNAYDHYSLQYFPSADIIIDDGPHSPESQIWAVKNLSHRIKPGGILVIEDVADPATLDQLKNATPFHLKEYVEYIDLRNIKGRQDDIMFVIRIPEKTGVKSLLPTVNTTAASATTDETNLLLTPTGAGMDMMAERLSHIKNLIDFNNIKSIIDVGSAHGYESLNMARVFKNAQTFGFEPTPEHYQHCLKIKQESGDVGTRMHFTQAALNNIDGAIQFYPLDNEQSRGNNTGMASKFRLMDPAVFPHELSVQKEITVNAVTLDTWCAQNNIQPDIIWMDAQGAELDILKGAEQALESVKVILTEVGLIPYYHGHTLKADIDGYLASLGFRELVTARKLGHKYEMDTIYVKD